jgi:hypothetical protein
LNTAVSVGAAIEAKESTVRAIGKTLDKRSGVVWVMDEGQKRYFLVEDPAVVEALSSLEAVGFGPITKALGKFKQYLTFGVTVSPFFKVKNLIRDSVQAIGTSDLSYNPLKNLKQGIASTNRKSQDYITLLASGAVIRFGSSMEGDEASRVRDLVNSGIKGETILDSDEKVKAFINKMKPFWEVYKEIGDRGEEINRAAIYKQIIPKLLAKKMTADEAHAQAAFLARDLMDFSMQGSWGWIRSLTQVVPFMNARLQGIYKLGRATKEDKTRMAIVIGAASLLGVALSVMYGDDDDWKKRTDVDRNNFWWFKFGGTAYRIPKPFEIGAAATVAEYGWGLFFDNEMTGKRFSKNVGDLLLSNLSMNPIPQAFKPILDVWSNKNMYTGLPIETMGMEKIAPEMRYTSDTSSVAKGLSTVGMGVLSPVQIDHMLRGYFAFIATISTGAADIAVNLASSGPAKPSTDMLSTVTGGMVRTLPEKQSRYVNMIYEQAKELEEVYGTQQDLLRRRKLEEYREFSKENKEKLIKYRMVEPIKKIESALTKQIRMVENDPVMGGDEKRLKIQEINNRKDQLARRLSARFQ